MQTQTPDCLTDCPSMAVNHLHLVLPILQIIASPPRQTFNVWTPSSQSIGCLAVQILKHIEMYTVPVIKQLRNQQESMVCTCIGEVNQLVP